MRQLQLPSGRMIEIPDKEDVTPDIKASIVQQIEQDKLAPAPTQPELGLGEALVQGFQNIPESAARFGSDIASAGSAVVGGLQAGAQALGLEPTDQGSRIPEFEELAATILGIATGGLKKFTKAVHPFLDFGVTPTGEGPDVDKFDAVVNFLDERFGSFENFKKTIATDPVGLASDLSALLGIGGATLTKVARPGLVAKTGKTLRKISKAIDPPNLVIKGAKVASFPVRETLAGVLGITTGVGPETIKAVARGGKAQRAARGGPIFGKIFEEISESQVVVKTRDAINQVREIRRANYKKQLEIIGRDKQILNFRPVKDRLSSLMKEFGVEFITDPKTGELVQDFSRSKLDRSAWKPMSVLIDDVNSWGSKPGDLTPIGMDLLKQRVDDFFSPTKNSRAFIAPLRDTIKKTLTDSVPGYEKLVGDYRVLSNEIEQIEKALSLSPKAGADTILRKLNTMMRENQGLRRTFAEKLELVSGEDIRGLVAGTATKPIVPGNRLLPAIAGAEGVGVAIATGRPEFLALLGFASPKLVAEFTDLISSGLRGVAAIGEKLPTRSLFQAGRAKREFQGLSLADKQARFRQLQGAK